MFDERQLQNLLLFLDRVECKGLEEASALVELVIAIRKAEDIEDTNDKLEEFNKE